MPLDPELQPIVDLINSLEAPPPQEQPVAEIRAAYAGLSTMFGAGPDEVLVEDDAVPGPGGEVAVRWYVPPTLADQEVASGVLVFFHGGGWVIGSIDTHDPLCRDLAIASGCRVLSVEYRLAPEHPFPAAIEDCRAVTEWVAANAEQLRVDPARIAVGGDSAGGQLAAVVARHWPDGFAPLALQVLIYPVTDLSALPLDDSAPSTSLRENGTGYVLTLETMEYFADAYVPDRSERLDPDASPLLAPDLTGSAPALVITAEFDPLRDEGEAYAARLADAGVPVVATRYDGATHMFVQMPTLGIARRAIAEVADAVGTAIG